MVRETLLSTYAAALCTFKNLEKNVRQISRADARVRLLMSAPGVGPLVALTYVSAINDPKRFTSSKRVGAHFGLTPKKYQSGETDISGRISKIGDSSLRAVLYDAAHIILTRPIHGGALKSWAMRLAKRAGIKKGEGSVPAVTPRSRIPLTTWKRCSSGQIRCCRTCIRRAAASCATQPNGLARKCLYEGITQ
jgi:transposase